MSSQNIICVVKLTPETESANPLCVTLSIKPVRHQQINTCLRLPVSQVTKLSKKHVSDSAEVLSCFITTELQKDQLFVSDVRRATDHQSSFL